MQNSTNICLYNICMTNFWQLSYIYGLRQLCRLYKTLPVQNHYGFDCFHNTYKLLQLTFFIATPNLCRYCLPTWWYHVNHFRHNSQNVQNMFGTFRLQQFINIPIRTTAYYNSFNEYERE